MFHFNTLKSRRVTKNLPMCKEKKFNWNKKMFPLQKVCMLNPERTFYTINPNCLSGILLNPNYTLSGKNTIKSEEF